MPGTASLRDKHSPMNEARQIWYRGSVCRVFIAAMLASGLCAACSGSAQASFLAPGGPIAAQEGNLFYWVIGLMMIVLIPVFVLVPWFAWRYRRSNSRSEYRPGWDFSWPLEFLIWGVPVLLLLGLAFLIWPNTVRLDPYKPVDGTTPMEVQVVGLDWKWLFIYPELNIATVKEMAFPMERQVHFAITSDTVMQSFFIPTLGSQVYAMAGMVTQLHLKADRAGTFKGENNQFNGMGFQDQKFAAIALPASNFKDWVRKVRELGRPLDENGYKALEERTTVKAPVYFSSVEPGLFRKIVQKYALGNRQPLASRPDRQEARR